MQIYEEQIYRAIEAQYEAVYVIDRAEKKFEPIKSSPFWDSFFGEDRSLRHFFICLFVRNYSHTEMESPDYQVFVDDAFFEKKNHQGNISLPKEYGGKDYMYQMIWISDEKSGFVIYPYEEGAERSRTERQKIDAIQENYLFSMIVDLKNDRCINSAISEVGGDAQSSRELKYSDWRNMISNMFLPEDRKMFFMLSKPENVIRSLEEQRSFKTELQMVNMTGQYIWVRLNFRRMKEFSRENPKFVYTVEDIDQDMRQLLNQENIIHAVEEQNVALLRADQAKNTFISNMSHEIRTPINAVIGMNEMIIRETEDEKIRSYANDIKNASHILLSIINDILDFSKIESGKMEIIPEEYNPAELIRNACNLISLKLKEKSLAFDLRVNPQIPCKLYGDDIRISQVIINLLTNAAKYTESGKVTFSVDMKKEDKNKLLLLVSVEDTGIGMRKEEMEKLFSAFVRLDERRNRNIEGTGLGMSIVTRLLEQMGSRLEVESEYGKGSKFSFSLVQDIVDESPIGEVLTENSSKQNREEASKKELLIPNARILAVDDNKTNLRVIKALLKRTQAQVELAESGEDALGKLMEQSFDLIFLDHFMPGMDGIETLTKIRQMGEGYTQIPVIALTANAVSGAKDYYMGVGFSDFLEKPIDVVKLEEMLSVYLPEKCFS